MDKKWIIAAFIAIFALSSCLEKEVYQGPEEDEKEFNDFDFSTVQSATSLEVSYANSGVKANVYFEVYDEIPVEQDEYTYTKKTNVTPLFAAYTADNSVYKGTIDLPAYLQKVYIYTVLTASFFTTCKILPATIPITNPVTVPATRRKKL